MWRLTKDAAEATDEVRLGHVRHGSHGADVERLSVRSIHRVARPQQTPVEVLDLSAHRTNATPSGAGCDTNGRFYDALEDFGDVVGVDLGEALPGIKDLVFDVIDRGLALEVRAQLEHRGVAGLAPDLGILVRRLAAAITVEDDHVRDAQLPQHARDEAEIALAADLD